jgi:hypothetical protein
VPVGSRTAELAVAPAPTCNSARGRTAASLRPRVGHVFGGPLPPPTAERVAFLAGSVVPAQPAMNLAALSARGDSGSSSATSTVVPDTDAFSRSSFGGRPCIGDVTPSATLRPSEGSGSIQGRHLCSLQAAILALDDNGADPSDEGERHGDDDDDDDAGRPLSVFWARQLATRAKGTRDTPAAASRCLGRSKPGPPYIDR